MPYYIDGSVKLTQSLAILRYIARKTGLDGTTESEKNAIALVEQQVSDLDSAMRNVAYDFNSDPKWEQKKAEYLANLPASLALLSAFLSKKPYVAGPKINYVDFWLYEFLKKLSIMAPGSLDAFTNLGAFLVRIETLPQMVVYFKAAKPGLFNGPLAKWNATA